MYAYRSSTRHFSRLDRPPHGFQDTLPHWHITLSDDLLHMPPHLINIYCLHCHSIVLSCTFHWINVLVNHYNVHNSQASLPWMHPSHQWLLYFSNYLLNYMYLQEHLVPDWINGPFLTGPSAPIMIVKDGTIWSTPKFVATTCPSINWLTSKHSSLLTTNSEAFKDGDTTYSKRTTKNC